MGCRKRLQEQAVPTGHHFVIESRRLKECPLCRIQKVITSLRGLTIDDTFAILPAGEAPCETKLVSQKGKNPARHLGVTQP